MTATIIDGRAIAAEIRQQIAAAVLTRHQRGLATPGLAVIMLGDDPASAVYVRNKRIACHEVGFESHLYDLPATTPETELIALIHLLNDNPAIHGILVQLPLPAQINPETIIETISPHKDVDGFHPYNLGRLAQRRPHLRPCTPYGVMQLIQRTGIPPKTLNATVIGASNIVGRPMSLELLAAGCTVTICHRFTQDIAQFVARSNCVVAAIGNPGVIKSDWIQPGAIVIDVGITRRDDGTLVGDIDFATAKERAGWITPVPGGVGPMTIAVLLQNTLQAATLLEA